MQKGPDDVKRPELLEEKWPSLGHFKDGTVFSFLSSLLSTRTPRYSYEKTTSPSSLIEQDHCIAFLSNINDMLLGLTYI